MPKYAQSSTAAVNAIKARRPLSTYGNLSAQISPDYYSGWNYGIAETKYFADHSRIDYVVYSYATPIAWHTPDDGWTVISRTFSATTNRAQAAVRQALWPLSDHIELQRDYRLSIAQELLRQAALDAPVQLRGQAKRSADALVRLGLATVTGSTLTLTPVGVHMAD